MIIIVGLLLALVSVPLAGGHLTEAADLRFKVPWVIGLALLTQVVIVNLVSGGGPARPILHMITYVLAGVFLAQNRNVRGLWVLILGAGLNAFVIGLNGGIMPVNETAIRTAGLDLSATDYATSAPRSGAHLAFLGDVFAVPKALPFSNVFSIGDVLIVVGAGAILHAASGSRLSRRSGRREAAAPVASTTLGAD